MTRLEHWMIWKKKCALDLCSAEIQEELRDFAHFRFVRFASAYAKETNVGNSKSIAPEPAHVWHCFETWLCLNSMRKGKAYKEWLFARQSVKGKPTLDSVQGGATLLMRQVVREFIRNEFSAQWIIALDAPIGSTDDGVECSFHELLPGSADTASSVELGELESIATTDAAEAMNTLGFRERVALLARELGLPLSHPAALSVAGCAKSILSSAYHNALVGIAGFVKAKYAREDREIHALLTVMIFERVKTCIIFWGKSENACSQLSMLVENGHDRRPAMASNGRQRKGTSEEA